jgi:tetratricopeptide (TPR) repeat protein
MTRRAQLGILLAVSSFVYANSLFNSFTMDDELYIFGNPQVTRPSLKQLFQANKVSAVFRPVTFATFAVNYKLNGDRPFGYHLLNLLLHAGATMLLFLVLREILANEPRGDIIAFVAALLFAVHPLHTEAVASIVGRSELLAAGFLLAAWLFHLRGRTIATFVCFAFAVLSKESAIALLPLAVAGDYARGKLLHWARYVPIAAATFLYAFVLWKVHGNRFGLQEVSLLDNPLSHLPVSWRIANAIRIAWKYVALQLFPAKLSCDYSFSAIRLYANLQHTLPAIVAAAGVLAVCGWTIWKKKPGFMIAGTIYFTGFAITANILVITGTIMAERLAYLPSAGFCLLIALLWKRLEVRRRSAAIVFLLLLVAVFGVRTLARNRDWRDNLSLYQSAVHTVPGSAKMHSNVGREYLKRGQLDQARAELQNALAIYPEYPDALQYLALVESWTGHDLEAIRLLESAVRMSDRKNLSYDFMVVNLAAMLMQAGRSSDALDILNREIAEAPQYSRAWSNRAVIYFQRGDTAAARNDAESSLRMDPSNSQARSVLNKISPALQSLPSPRN